MLRRMPDNLPKHVGVMLDGNRRWARAVGRDTARRPPGRGGQHRAAARLVRRGRHRGRHAVAALDRQPQPARGRARPAAGDHRGRGRRRWPTGAAGGCIRWARSTCCPPRRPQQLKAAEEATRDVDGMLVNVAVGYGGRREIADAVRSLLSEHAARGTSLEELAQIIDVEHIAEHLYTKGQPDPDLVIRTSGEQRLGGFLLWQSAQVGVLLLRGLLARLPPGRLPAGDPRLRRARAPLRGVTNGSPPGRACRTGRPAAAAYVRDIGEWGSLPYREARILREHDPRPDHRRSLPAWPEGRERRPALRPSGSLPVRLQVRVQDRACECARRSARGDRAEARGQLVSRRVRARSPAAHLRPRHQRPAGRSRGAAALRRARGGAARRGHHRAGGQAAPSRAGLLRPAGAAAARRAAGHRTAGSTRRCRSATTAARSGSSSTTPTRRRCPSGFRLGRQRHPHPRGGAATSRSEGADVTLVSKDLPLRVKASAVGLDAEEYRGETISDSDPGYTGMAELEVAGRGPRRALRRRRRRPRGGPRPALPHRAWCCSPSAVRRWAGSAPTSRSTWCAATARRSASTAARPSSGSRSTCCSTPRSASSRSAAGPAPASPRWRCAPGSRR